MAVELQLLPGLMCDGAVWAGQIDKLKSSANCNVADYGDLDSIPAMADAVLAYAPRRFSLAGHSMGGRVALEIVRKAPERVERLALLDTGYQARPAGDAGEVEAKQRGRLLDIARSQGMRTMAREWVQGMVHPERLCDEALLEDIVAMVARHTPETFAAQIRALLNRPEAGDVLPQVCCPTWLICGRQDGWSPLPRHEVMANLIPGARLEVIEDSGHMAPMERPAAVAAVLDAWLAAS